jgi:hypothetical protein
MSAYAPRSGDQRDHQRRQRKASLDYRVYITDARGIVVFDSDGRDVGRDYSRWRDVYLNPARSIRRPQHA